MGMGHRHGSGRRSAGAEHRSRLLAVLALTSTVLVAELVGAWVTGSLALLADAGHMTTDVAGILIAVSAVTLAQRPPTAERSYGYYRLEILAAVANAVLLLFVAGFVLVEAWRRWGDPPDVDGWQMTAFAVVGLVANIAGLLLLHRGSRSSLNVRGAYLEVLGDTFGSVAVIVAGTVIATTGWMLADPLASVLVAALILPRTWSLLREAVDVLLEATPSGFDLADARDHILATPGVVDAHDLHVWTLTSGLPVLSVHVVVDDDALTHAGTGRILDALGHCLADHFDVEHCTFQLEPVGHADHEHTDHP